MSFEMERKQFYNTIYDDELNDYINGNFIANIKKKNLEKEEQETINMSIIIDYHFDKYNIEKSNENIQKYIDMYNEIINNNFVIVDKENRIPFYKTKEGFEYDKEIKENEEYENDKNLHYQQYFMRYKDIEYIIEHYRKMIEDFENKEYDIDENNTNISDDESYTSDIDDYMYDEYFDDYEEEEYYDEGEYY
jgi:hypothetical protein